MIINREFSMVNLLLLALMIAALLGMVFCNRQQKKNARFQLIALSLLIVVIASGGMFMCRLSSLSMLGGNTGDTASENDKKLQASQGYVVANFIRNSYPGKNQVLLIMPEGVSQRSAPFIEELRNGSIGNLRIELIRQNNSDKLITPAADSRNETRAIDEAIARHSDAQTIILYGLAPSGNTIRYLQVYDQPYSKRAKIIVLGLSNLNDWAARQLREGFFDALVITDLTRVSRSRELLPDNHMEVFDSCYVLVTRDNLNRNRRYFH